MKAIGGYFDSESSRRTHENKLSDRYQFNLGRNALKFYLQARNINKVSIPYYICDSVLEVFNDLGVETSFYGINENLEAIESGFQPGSLIIYVNYFGIKTSYITQLLKKYGNCLIDNSQSYYTDSFPEAFYSPRKFFEVPDGGELISKHSFDFQHLETDISVDRHIHLLLRSEGMIEKGYEEYKNLEQSFSHLPLKLMSDTTSKTLRLIDHENVINTRNRNFNYLHQHLGSINQLEIVQDSINGPMVYPFLVTNGKSIKSRCIENEIFVATYWNSVLEKVSQDSFETYLVNNLVPLPVDQRYDLDEMDYIIHNIKSMI